MTPVLQRPLELGADVVVQSATKYLAGHSDLLAGTVTTDDPQLAEAYALSQKAEGGVLAPLDSFRLIQAIKTLPLRLERQQDNAAQIAAFLREREDVTVVHTPGSFSEEEARLHAAQAEGPGAVLSFELAPDLDRVAFLQALRYLRLRRQPRRRRIADLPPGDHDPRGHDPPGPRHRRDLR